MLDNGLTGIGDSAGTFVAGNKRLHHNALGSPHADRANTSASTNKATSRPTTATTKELCMNKLAGKGASYRAAIAFETAWQASLRRGPMACEAQAQAFLKREDWL
jgi:hypothetical protein